MTNIVDDSYLEEDLGYKEPTKTQLEEAKLILAVMKQTTMSGKGHIDIAKNKVIDTLDIAIAVIDKQIPKKPIRKDKNGEFDGNWTKICPTCGRLLVERITTPEESRPIIYNNSNVCLCGQALDRD